MLATNIKTNNELMSIALQAEREAIRRYSQLAGSMREAGNEAAAALFERMVNEEQEHEKLLLQWMDQEGIEINENIGPISWQDPNVATTYNDEACAPYYSTPYKALAFAVHNEEIAFRFYTQVAADSEDKTVREHAEVLAREELGHAALLRAERRRAYHAEREAGLTAPALDPGTVHNTADLLAAAIYIDRYLADGLEKMAEGSSQVKSLISETRRQISDNEKRLQDIRLQHALSPGEEITTRLDEIKQFNEKTADDNNAAREKIQRLCAFCDRSFAFYDAVVETASDEAIMLNAQQLAASALDRIGVLKQAPDSICSSAE